MQEAEFPNQKIHKKIPELVNVLESKVESILDSQIQRGGLQYLVKWTDKPRHENTWEARSYLINKYWSQIAKFHTDHPDAPKPPMIRVPPMQVQEVTVQKEDTFTPQWGYWNRKFEQWHKRDNHCQMIIQLLPNLLPRIEAKEQQYITASVKLPPVKEFWLSTNDQVTHMTKVGQPIPCTGDNHWKFPIISY